MNEDCGPITELLCATNIIPANMSINPTINNILTAIDFLIAMKMLLIDVLLLVYCLSIIKKCHNPNLLHTVEKKFVMNRFKL